MEKSTRLLHAVWNKYSWPRIIAYGTLLTLSLMWIYLSIVPSGSSSGEDKRIPHAGFLAPEISLSNTKGENISLINLRGKPVVVNFWASWCPPCRAEMPALQKVYKDYEAKGLVVLAVNSTIQDTRSDAEALIDQNLISFPVLFDENGNATKQYQITSLPTTFFISPDGIIREIAVGGPMPEALIRTRVDKLFEEMP